MINAFLSASVPLPERDKRFMESADVVAIREAIKGLVSVVIPKGRIVYGGHPAITPLMALLLRDMGKKLRRRVVLYQSSFFKERFVSENEEFLDLRLIPAVGNSQSDSLTEMRRRMLTDTNFNVGIFVGGMEGVLEEFKQFRKIHPNAAIWPIASTGAAAKEIFEKLGSPKPEIFLKEMTYSSLFRGLTKNMEKVVTRD